MLGCDAPTRMDLLSHLRHLSSLPYFPAAHTDFLRRLRDEHSFTPKVAYDLGACVLHWTQQAKTIWPDASFCLVDGFVEAEPLWKESGYPYYAGVLSDCEKEVSFYVNPVHPGGNSYYKEIGSPYCNLLFPECSARRVHALPLDAVRKTLGWPFPDLVKMDVQGSELDIYKGAKETLRNCKYLIVELQHKPYNLGAPLANEVIRYFEQDGWELFAPLFTVSEFDGDYCFRRGSS